MTTHLSSYIQIICVIIACAVSSGGGNSPEYGSNNLYFLKGFLATIPYACLLITCLNNKNMFLTRIIRFFRLHGGIVCAYFLCLLSIPLAVDWQYSLIRLLYTYFLFGSVLCACFNIYVKNDTVLNKKLIIAISVLTAFPLFLYGIYTQTFLASIPSFRQSVQGTELVHPNTLSSFICMLFLWFLTLHDDKRYYILKLSLCAIIYLLFSRSALLILIMMLLVIILRNALYYKNIKPIFCAWISLIIIAITAFYFNIFDTHEFLSYVSRDGNIDNIYTASHRLTLWHNLIADMTMKTFMIGNGYSVIHPDFGIDFGTGILYGAHNAYLSVLLGNGFICLISFLVCFIYMWCTAYCTQSKQVFSFSMILIFFLLYSLFSEEFGITITPSLALLLILYTISCRESDVSP